MEGSVVRERANDLGADTNEISRPMGRACGSTISK